MSLKSITLTNLRNLKEASISLLPKGFNVFYGENGSGKTSLLEAIHILSVGRSFRTSDLRKVIAEHQPELTVFAKLQNGNKILPVGVARRRSGEMQLKIAGEDEKLATISQLLPVRLINPTDAGHLFDGGPSIRRKFIDWGVFHVEHPSGHPNQTVLHVEHSPDETIAPSGVFHVEHSDEDYQKPKMFHVKQSYWEIWKRFQTVLKQRNAALKQGRSSQEMQLWDHAFCEVSQKVHQARERYLEGFGKVFSEISQDIPLFKEIHFDYRPGWDVHEELQTVLANDRMKEYDYGHTIHGPHRADLQIKTGQALVKDYFSRGQQKLLLVAMMLAQGQHLQTNTQKQPIYLIDDFASELDQHSQALLSRVLESQDAQVILTCLHLDDFTRAFKTQKKTNVFHINQGVIESPEAVV